jgi:hypothetical protein
MSVLDRQQYQNTNRQDRSNSNSFQNSNLGFTMKSDINHNPHSTTNRMSTLSGTSKINPVELGYQPKENTSTFRVNPMIFQSILEKTDVDKLEEDLAREIQKKKCSEDKREVNSILIKINIKTLHILTYININ